MDFTVDDIRADLTGAQFIRWGTGDMVTPDRFTGVLRLELGTAELDVENVDGRLICRGVRLDVARSDEPVRPADLRLPLGRMLDAIAAKAALRVHRDPEVWGYRLTPAGDTVRPGEVPRRRRRRITEDHLDLVADVYVAAVRAGKDPTAAVQDSPKLMADSRTRTPRSTASRWVKAARPRIEERLQ